MVSPETILFAVRAVLRIGRAARDAYEQEARDSDILLPLPPAGEVDVNDWLTTLFTDPRFRGRVGAGGDLQAFWDGDRMQPRNTADARQHIIDAAELIWQTDLAKPNDGRFRGARRVEEAGLVVLKQWAAGQAPPPPLARLAIAIADVAIDYVGANPQVLGVGSSGERLVLALAGNLKDLLPNADNPQDWDAARWSTYYFAERAITIFVHAGLKTVSEHTDLLIGDEHFRALVDNVLSPLVKQFESDPTHAPSLIVLRDALLGPVASAALSTLAKNQGAFFGHTFDSAKPLGAVTQALLAGAADLSQVNIRQVFTDQGLVRLYQSTLQVMIDRPELFVGGGASATAQLTDTFFQDLARTLQGAPPPFDKALAGKIGAVALDALGQYSAHFLDGGDSWEALAQRAVAAFVDGAKAGLQSGSVQTVFQRVLSRQQLVSLTQAFFEQAAKTPGMLVGDKAGEELKAVVAAVFRTMAARGSDLLSGDDWLAIAAVAAEEAARNPERLFKLGTDPDSQLAAKLIRSALSVAADAFAGTAGQSGRQSGAVLFGQTLREAITSTLRAAVGNTIDAEAHLPEIEALLRRVSQLAASQQARLGAREALWLIQQLLTTVIDSGTLGVVRSGAHVDVALKDVTDDELLALLNVVIKEVG